ncbi:hypothetical protein SISNIDRAFT_455046 [Sistotremastrum niveocremeum HHB9708]|uniref:Chalcone isomerase domain-containing protein n=1 Tax=Sistotremastrum niveocremeum HHB9708 TaxID=1314777 RepID=A0A164UBA1_9AGAM|nr:hypothetical protein SISNIDRAFT_455046 [Sistotremastrum niveocremeum HHB9708]
MALTSAVHLDAPAKAEIREDTATSIPSETSLRIPSRPPLPTCTLLGVGVRKVSFLRVKVYSVALYADLSDPKLEIPKTLSADEQISYIINNTTCILRIVPTRSTSFSHLRDGFMRALYARAKLARDEGTLSSETENGIQGPLRKLKSMFPNMPLQKHTPLDIILLAPQPGKQRTLIVRDLGSVEDSWVATEFFQSYFSGEGISPPMKQDVIRSLEHIETIR